eukprot:TRINITY_DN3377_c0_g1_i1.p1 TRINITY_DN3377_c0_g1~~TRINITY_DN3377_c0_g1_i1.p1  ORF type:complete len:1005 (+),score=298.57 TRINITY_DN3377_c0_g1_i1:56-3070(+)
MAAMPDEAAAACNTRALGCFDRGDVAGARGALDEAWGWVQQISDVAERGRAEAATLTNSGYVAKLMGDLDEAAHYLERALEVEAQYGAPQPTTTLNLAVVLNSKGVYNRARDLSKLALALLEEKEASEHPPPPQVWVAAWHNLAVSQLWATNKALNVDTVWEHFRTAVRLAKESLGRQHPLTREVVESFRAAKRSWQATKVSKQQGHARGDDARSTAATPSLAATPRRGVDHRPAPPPQAQRRGRRPPPPVAPAGKVAKTKAGRAAERARNKQREEAWDETTGEAAAPVSPPAVTLPRLPTGGGVVTTAFDASHSADQHELHAQTALLKQLEAETERKDAALEALRQQMAGRPGRGAGASAPRSYTDMSHDYALAQMELTELKRQLFVLRRRVGDLSKSQAMQATRRTVQQTWEYYSDHAQGHHYELRHTHTADASPPSTHTTRRKSSAAAAAMTYPYPAQRHGSKGRPLPELPGHNTTAAAAAQPPRAPLPPLNAWQQSQPPVGKRPDGRAKPHPPRVAARPVWNAADADTVTRAAAAAQAAAGGAVGGTVPGSGLAMLYASLKRRQRTDDAAPTAPRPPPEAAGRAPRPARGKRDDAAGPPRAAAAAAPPASAVVALAKALERAWAERWRPQRSAKKPAAGVTKTAARQVKQPQPLAEPKHAPAAPQASKARKAPEAPKQMKEAQPATEPKQIPAQPTPPPQPLQAPAPGKEGGHDVLKQALLDQSLHNLNLLLEVESSDTGDCAALNFLHRLVDPVPARGDARRMRMYLFGDDRGCDANGTGLSLLLDMATEDAEYWNAAYPGTVAPLRALHCVQAAYHGTTPHVSPTRAPARVTPPAGAVNGLADFLALLDGGGGMAELIPDAGTAAPLTALRFVADGRPRKARKEGPINGLPDVLAMCDGCVAQGVDLDPYIGTESPLTALRFVAACHQRAACPEWAPGDGLQLLALSAVQPQHRQSVAQLQEAVAVRKRSEVYNVLTVACDGANDSMSGLNALLPLLD